VNYSQQQNLFSNISTPSNLNLTQPQKMNISSKLTTWKSQRSCKSGNKSWKSSFFEICEVVESKM